MRAGAISSTNDASVSRIVRDWWIGGKVFLNSAQGADLLSSGAMRPAQGNNADGMFMLFVENLRMLLREHNGDYYLVDQDVNGPDQDVKGLARLLRRKYWWMM